MTNERDKPDEQRGVSPGRGEDAGASEASWTAIASAIAHDIKTPLATLQVASDALLTPGSGRAQRRFLGQVVRRQAARLDRMVSELIESLRLASGDLRLEPEPCDLERLVADACEEFRLLQPGRDLRVLTSGPLVLRLDPDKITSVIENLLSNAVLHSGSSAPITVSLGHDAAERRAVLRVGDRGPGLPQARREEMTKPVVSFDAQGRVHGLGLFSVRLIVEAHGGRVWSETGSEGFAVCVGLPMENSKQL